MLKPAPFSAKPKLINFTLLLLRVVLDHGLKLGYINDNPTLHVRFCGVTSRRGPVTLTDHDLEKILENCSTENNDLFRFLAGTGVRVTEALELRWQNVDFQKRSLKIAQREVPMDMDVFALLEKKAAGSLVSQNGFVFAGSPSISEFQEDLARSAKRSNLAENIYLSTFRHSFVRRLLEDGVAPVRVCWLAGFDDIARIMHYWAFVPAEKRLI